MKRRKRGLTDFQVKNAKPRPVGYEISDDDQRGLRLAVHPTGQKSWVVRYRRPVSGKSRKLTLKPGLGLAEARKLAGDAMFQVAQGIDPIDAKREQKQAEVTAVEGTLNAVCKQYLKIATSKLRSHGFYKSVLDRHILPHLGEQPVAELKRSEIVAALDKVESKSGPSASDMALAILSAVLSWYEKRSDVFRSPIIKGMRRVKASEQARDRVLSDDEIRSVWKAAGDERIGLYGQVVRFMILTGARRSEAAGLRRTEIETVRDNGSDIVVWRLPASRSKNKREVVRPVSAAALAIIQDQPQIGDCDFAFSLDGNRAMSMNYGSKALLDEIAGVEGWVLHDLRRVYRSLLSRCRVPFEIAERLLGHAQPTLVQTYDRHSHLPVMLEAVEKVAAEVERIVSGEREGRVIRPGAVSSSVNLCYDLSSAAKP
jgi:integrase